MHIEYKTDLPDADVKARLRALGEYLTNRHGIGVTWESDTKASVRGRYMVVTIEGSVVIERDVVKFDGKDPGFLWRGKAKDYLLGKLKKYLDRATPLTELPRR